MVVVQSPCIPTATAFMIPAVLLTNVTTPTANGHGSSPATASARPGRCTLTFHPNQDRIHCPSYPCNSGTNPTLITVEICAPVHPPVTKACSAFVAFKKWAPSTTNWTTGRKLLQLLFSVWYLFGWEPQLRMTRVS